MDEKGGKRMKVKRLCMVLVLSALCVTGCREPANKTAVRTPEPQAASTAGDKHLPGGKESKPVRALGDMFCKASVKADFQGMVDLFYVEFLIRANPGIARLVDEAAMADMTRDTEQAMRNDIKASRSARIKECEIATADTLSCMDMARYVVQSPRDDLTTGSIKAALDESKINECGLLVVRETSNAATEEPVFFVGKAENKWMILLGMPEI